MDYVYIFLLFQGMSCLMKFLATVIVKKVFSNCCLSIIGISHSKCTMDEAMKVFM